MSLSIKRKIERAFARDYLPKILTIRDLTIYEGHDPVAEMKFPALIVYAETAVNHPDMPPETGSKIVRLRCQFNADSTEDGTRSRLDDWREELECAMLNTAAIQAALNISPARLIRGIHIHEAMAADDASETSETDFREEMAFEVVCEPVD